MSVQLYLGDCLEVMKSMPDKSVDAVITDPPYKVMAGASGGAFGNRDSLVNTGGFTDSGVDYAFLEGFENWICFCSKKQLKTLIDLAEKREHWNLLTWNKTNPLPTCNNKYLPDVEYIVHVWKSGNLYGGYGIKSTFMVLPTGGSTTKHPNEKPLPLMRKLILLSSKEGDTILDPFMGSGTTGVACVQTGRNFIGIEIDPTYFAIAERRIKEAQLQLRLPTEVQE